MKLLTITAKLYYQRAVTIIVLSILITSCSTGLTYNNVELSDIKRQAIASVAANGFEHRESTKKELDKVYSIYWNSPKLNKIHQNKTMNTGEFFKLVPIFTLIDRDGDGKADQFSYSKTKQDKDSKEFGFIYDLNKDGKIDYLVFYGGSVMTKELKLHWFNYHFIDSNFDNKFDIYVNNGAIDLNNDGLIDDKNISAWVYDRDFDGKIDSAEYLGTKTPLPIPVIDNTVLLKTIFNNKEQPAEKIDSAFVGFSEHSIFEQILKEINSKTHLL